MLHTNTAVSQLIEVINDTITAYEELNFSDDELNYQRFILETDANINLLKALANDFSSKKTNNISISEDEIRNQIRTIIIPARDKLVELENRNEKKGEFARTNVQEWLTEFMKSQMDNDQIHQLSNVRSGEGVCQGYALDAVRAIQSRKVSEHNTRYMNMSKFYINAKKRSDIDGRPGECA